MSSPDGTPPNAGESPAPPHEGADSAVVDSAVIFDRHLVLEQLGGWRGMVDATVPTLAFIVANGLGGLRVGIWAALGVAVVIFGLRLVRRESVQQAVSGLFAVGVAVAIAAATGQARNYYVPGILRNALLTLVFLGSIVVRRPLVGVIAEFLAPSHLGAMAEPRSAVPGLRRRAVRARAVLDPEGPTHEVEPAGTGRRGPDPAPEQPWREDSRLVRAYSWLTVLWVAAFLLRAGVQGYVYLRTEDGDATDLGVVSLLLGMPVTAVVVVITLWVIARLHRHRSSSVAGPATPDQPAG